MSRLVLILLPACMAACAPVVTHGPRVEQGFTFYGTAGGGRPLCDRQVCDTNLAPQQGAGLRYGHAATASAPGFSAGLTVSSAFVSSELDLYLQAPASLLPGLDLGVGVLAAGTHGMPYLQAGRMKPDGSGWYTTQGFAFLAPRPARWSLSPEGGSDEEQVEPRYWAPTIAYRTRGQYGLHFYATGAFGTADAKKYRGAEPGFRTERQPVRVVMMGIVFDVQPARPKRPLAPPPAPGVAAPAAAPEPASAPDRHRAGGG